MKNAEVAKALYEIGELLMMKDGGFKAVAYQRAARTIESLPVEISDVYKEGGMKGLEGIPGVGEGIAKKIAEFIKTGKMRKLVGLKREEGKGVVELMGIPGLGPKKIKKLKEKLGVKNISDLKRALKEHKIRKIEGFGAESEKDISENIGFRAIEERIPWAKGAKIANDWLKQVKKIKAIDKVVIGGSIRRKKASVRDIDLIALSKHPEQVTEQYVKLPGIQKVLAKGNTKATVVLKAGLQADIRVFDKESWGAGLLYFTGNKNYNIEIRKVAIKKGWKLNEYGLFDKKTGKRIAGKTEEEVLGKLGLKWVKPEKREI